MNKANGLPKGYEVVEVSDGTGGYEYVVQASNELTEAVVNYFQDDYEDASIPSGRESTVGGIKLGF